MISKIWSKKVAAIVEMDPEDVADAVQPLPIVMSLSWNHYVGTYRKMLIKFFYTYLPFPANED